MCADIKVAKAKIRDNVSKAILALSPDEQEKQSNIIVDKLLGLAAYKDSKRISIYLSMTNEVQTDRIVEDIFLSGKECFIPRYTKTGMVMLKLKSMEDLQSLPLTKWNIRQPLLTDQREDALEKGIDLMILPGLAFTEKGSRLGRGKGYYDKYLDEYHKKIGNKLTTIALAFQQQVLTELPTTETDFKLDMVIYPDFNVNVVAPETSRDYDGNGIK